MSKLAKGHCNRSARIKTLNILIKPLFASILLAMAGFGLSLPAQAVNGVCVARLSTGGINGIAVGTASGTNAVACGDGAVAAGPNNVAIGAGASAAAMSSIAIGDASNAAKDGTIAIGQAAGSNSTTITKAIFIGSGAGANSKNSTSVDDPNTYIGVNAGENSDGYRNTVVGSQNAGTTLKGNMNAGFGMASLRTVTGSENAAFGGYSGQQSTGSENTAMGAQAGRFVIGSSNTGIGYNAGSGVTGNNNIALGAESGNKITANNTVSIGNEAKASADSAVAIGDGAKASAKNTISIGKGSEVNAENSGAIGDPSIVNAKNSYSVGNNNTLAKIDGSEVGIFALGNDITQTVDDSVFLGSKTAYVAAGERTKGVDKTYTKATIAGVEKPFAGGDQVVGVISVGSGAETRRIQNVAPGLIADKSTDAINGSQLYQVTEAFNGKLTHYYSVNDNKVISGNYNNDGATGVNAMAAGVDARAGATSRNKASTSQSNVESVNAIAIGTSATAYGTSGNIHLNNYGAGIAVGNRASAAESAIDIGQRTESEQRSNGNYGWRRGSTVVGTESYNGALLGSIFGIGSKITTSTNSGAAYSFLNSQRFVQGTASSSVGAYNTIQADSVDKKLDGVANAISGSGQGKIALFLKI